MARSDLIVSLVRAGTTGDRAMLRAAAEAIAAEERSKNHNILADRIDKALNSNVQHLAQPGTGPNGRDFLWEAIPQVSLDDLVIDAEVRRQVSELIEEQQRADLLRSYGLQPRHRILLSGPPGNGKTSLAEAIAEALAVPFFTVRYDALIGSFLGETNQRLRRLFEYIRTTSCVVLFDEFDALGKERGDVHETGEIKRVVSSLLLQIDSLPSYTVIVGATNHQELLDRAVWRRFQLRLDISPPSRAQTLFLLTRDLGRPLKASQKQIAALADLLKGSSYAELTDFALDVRRRIVLSHGAKRVDEAIRDCIGSWKHRIPTPLDAAAGPD